MHCAERQRTDGLQRIDQSFEFLVTFCANFVSCQLCENMTIAGDERLIGQPSVFQGAQDLEDDDEHEDENDFCKCATRAIETPTTKCPNFNPGPES
jgi:hypothetical protein